MEYLYKNGEGYVTGFEERRIEPYRWISLNSSVDNVPEEAAHYEDDPAMPDIGREADEHGRFVEMEWGDRPGWHHLSIHWHGFIPVDRTGTAEAWYLQLGKPTNLTSYTSGQRSLASGVAIEMSSNIIDLDHLIRGTKEDDSLNEADPIPKPFDTDQLHGLFATEREAYRIIAAAQRAMLDRIAYVRWWITCLPSKRELIGGMDLRDFEEAGYDKWEKRGVLLKLERDWEQVNIPTLLQHNVPIYYPWTDNLAKQPRFSRLDPAVLQAYHSFAIEDMESDEIPLWTDIFPQLAQFSPFLERISRPGTDKAGLGLTLASDEYFICDFRGWRKRPISNPTDIARYRTMYDSHIIETAGRKTTIFWRWKNLLGAGRLEESTQTQEEDTVSLGSLDDDEGSSSDPSDIEEIRELFKAGYAPRNGEVIDEESGSVIAITTPRSEGRRSLADRIESPHSRAPSASHSLQERLQQPRGRKGNPERQPFTGSRPISRDSTAMWVRRLARTEAAERPRPLSLSPSPPPGTRSSRGRSASPVPIAQARPPNAPRTAVIPTLQHTLDRSVRQTLDRKRFVKDFRAWGARATYTQSLYAFPDLKEAPWNRKLLDFGYLIVKDPRVMMRMRYWGICWDEIQSITDVIETAIAHGVRFDIGVKLSDMHQFRPSALSLYERETAVKPHGANFSEPTLEYGRGGIALRERYTHAAGDVLKRANAGAFVTMGGPASWLARKLGGEAVVAKLLAGPSHIVTWHNKGGGDSTTKDPMGLYREVVTPGEVDILFGQVSTGSHESDRWFFPPEELLDSRKGLFNGEWTAELERIYTQIYDEVMGPTPRPRNRGEWRDYIRIATNNEEGKKPPTPLAFFKEGCETLKAKMGPDWDTQNLSIILVKGHFRANADGE